MQAYFEIRNGSIVTASPDAATIHVFAAPNEAEKQQILTTLQIDRYDLESALDVDEISRIEFGPSRVYAIWKRPMSASFDERLRLEVISVGLFLDAKGLTVVTGDENIPFGSKEFYGVNSPSDVMLRFLLHTVRHYLSHLKTIKQITQELESKISTSMENRYLLQMFALGESLIYYLNAIEANGAVLAKLRSGAEKVPLAPAQVESLDDVALDNQQCARQAQIYSTILSGLMDARGTLVNNNMNVLLKNLTLINVVFLPLNLIASVWGMSEYSVITKSLDWRISYSAFFLGMAVLGWLTWLFLVRSLDRSQRTRERGAR